MGNMPSDTDPSVSVSRKSTWSVTAPAHGPTFTEYRETITENGVTQVRYNSSRDAYQGSGSGRNFHHSDCRHHQGDRPPMFGSGPERERVVRREDGHFVNGHQGGKPLPEARRQQRGPPPGYWDDGREPPLGGPSVKGTSVSGPSQGGQGKRPGGDNPRPLPQPSSRREDDLPPPYIPHAYPQSGKEAAFPCSDRADPRANPQPRPHPNHHLPGSDPTAPYPRGGSMDRGGIMSGGRPGTDPMAAYSSGARDRGIASRPLEPKGIAQMERDTSYKTRKAETAHFMIMSDEESEKKRMDITKDILNDLARR